MVFDNNEILKDNIQNKNGIKYIKSKNVNNVFKNINIDKKVPRNGPILQSIETYDLLEDARLRGKNCVDVGTYRNRNN